MDAWTPPFCPNPKCSFHCSPEGWAWIKMGFFSRKHCQPAIIQRYRCLHCRRTFSTQTFDTTYWLKRPDLLPLIFHRSLACSGLRQIASEYGVSPNTIQGQLSRLGRHCLLYQQRHQPEVEEPVVLDGFESFEYSQYFPFHFNVLVGKDSHFFYGFTDSPLRRKGSMTRTQKKRRQALECELGRPDPKALENGVVDLLKMLVPGKQELELYSDDHPAYPRAFKRLPGLSIRHDVTSSKERRTASNPLFPVNLLDLLFRHNGANHKRETIAYSKRRQGAIERLAVFQVWRNWMRSYSVRKRGPTPAQALGLRRYRLSLRELLRTRLFVSRMRLPKVLESFYWRRVKTQAFRVNTGHTLNYAF